MASSTLAEIKALIKTKLQDLKIGGIAVFGEVLDYAHGDYEHYPIAVINPIGGDGEVIDTHRIERTFRFTVKLYQEQSHVGKTPAEADTLMTAAADALLIAFDQDKDLGGEIEIVRVVDFDFDFKVAAGTFNFATFNINCVVIVPNYV
jgi:hypothetical protein